MHFGQNIFITFGDVKCVLGMKQTVAFLQTLCHHCVSIFLKKIILNNSFLLSQGELESSIIFRSVTSLFQLLFRSKLCLKCLLLLQTLLLKCS